MEIKVTEDNFEEEVTSSKIPVLLDFYAEWCGPCRMVAPILEELGRKYEGKLKIGKIDVDAEETLARAFEVESIPMLVAVKDGQIVESAVGYRTRDQLIALIEKIIA